MLERVAFRPLRGTSPATMLVATFAISFLLRSIYLLAFGSRGEVVGTLGGLNTAVAIGSLRIRWISIVALVVGGVLLPGRRCSSTGRRSACTSAPPPPTSARRASSAFAPTA